MVALYLRLSNITNIFVISNGHPDMKRIILAFFLACFMDGKYEPGQYDGLRFFRYDNASRSMEG